MAQQPMILHGPEVPCQGMRSGVPGPFLQPGLLKDARNVRSIGGAIVARDGCGIVDDSIVDWGDLRGMASIVLDGERYVYAALKTATVILQASADDGATWSAAGIPDTGPYNDGAQLADIGKAFFAVARDKARMGIDESDLLFITMQSDPIDTAKNVPLVRAKAVEAGGGKAVGSYVTSRCIQPPAPESVSVAISLPAGFPIVAKTSTRTNSGANFTGIDQGAGTAPPMLVLVAATGAASGDTVVYSWPAGVDFSNGKLFILASDGTNASGNYQPLLQYLKVEIGDGVAWTTVCEAGGLYNGVVVEMDEEDLSPEPGHSWAVGIDDQGVGLMIGIDIPTGGAADLEAIDRVRFTYKGDTVPAAEDRRANFSMFGPQGPSSVPIGTAACYYGSDHRCISPPTFSTEIDDDGLTPAWVAGTGAYDRDRRLFAEYSPLIDYVVTISVPRLAMADLEDGANKLLIFTNEDGQSGYYYCATVAVGSWTDAPTFAWGFDAPDPVVHTYDDDVQDLTWPVPADDVLSPPRCQFLSSVNNRLFCAGDSILWFSEYQRPTWFMRGADVDDSGNIVPTSAASWSVDGEALKAIAPLGRVGAASDSRGSFDSTADLIYVVTDRATRAVSGWDCASLLRPVVVAKVGTLSPLTVALGRDALFFLSTENQIVRMRQGQYSILSRQQVDDRLLAIPSAYVAEASGAFWNGRYYFAYTRAGQTENDRILVWDEDLGLWHGDDSIATVTIGMLLNHVAEGGTRLYIAEHDTGLFWHEKPGQAGDLATGIVPISMEFAEIRGNLDSQAVLEAVAVMADSLAATSLTTSRADLGSRNQSSAAGTISLVADGSRVMRQDRRAALRSEAIGLTISGSVVAGWTLYQVSAYASMDATGADA